MPSIQSSGACAHPAASPQPQFALQRLNNVLLIDPESPARATLRLYLEHHPNFTISGEATTGAEAIEMLVTCPSVVFLDVELPDMSGFDVLRARPLPDHCALIFATSHNEHAWRAFEVQAFDYLIKPISLRRFEQTLSRLERRLHQNNPLPTTSPGPLLCRDGNHAHFVEPSEIVYVESARNYLVIYTSSGSHIVRRTLDSLENTLDPAQFARISRSVIVNTSFIRAIETLTHGDRYLKLKTGQQILCSRRYAPRLRTTFPEQSTLP